MQRLHLPIALISAWFSFAQAAEHTVTEKQFQTEVSLKAVFLPSSSTAISIRPEAWTDFTVTSAVPQGSVVRKGDTLIGIETQKIDENIAEMEKSREAAALTLAQAKHDLAQLEATTPRNLAALERTEKQTAEDLKWYTEIGKPKEIEAAKRSVHKAEFALAYQKEELKQLQKMYAEDDKTEETEEIILTRTQHYVIQAEFALKVAKIEAEKTLTTAMPRKLKSLQLAAEDARIANAAAKEKLPRELKLKRLEVAKAVRDDAKNAEKLAKLKADRTMMNITAPADGVVYYGSMENGRWDPAAAAKVLKVGGKLPPNTTLMSFIPNDAGLTLHATITEGKLAQLTPDAKGIAHPSLNDFLSIPVSVSKLSSHPGTDGTYGVVLKPTLDKNTKIVPGMTARVDVTGRKIDKALAIPTKFVNRQTDGTFTVKLKLADGKTENRTVSVGASNNKAVVITKGLEKGQVIVE